MPLEAKIRTRDLHVYTHPLIRMRLNGYETIPQQIGVLLFLMFTRILFLVGELNRLFNLLVDLLP